MIEARGLTKRYGDRVAVEDLTFTVRPGIVTGFLGPNGAGKSTTMRMILGLDEPTTGTTGRRCTRSAACWRPGPAAPAGPPTTTCWPSRRPAASRAAGWTR